MSVGGCDRNSLVTQNSATKDEQNWAFFTI
jgi:hypothetical protein